MNIEKLKSVVVFAEVARQKSFVKAARVLALSPSVVSYHVSKLEQQLGSALLYRSTRRISLTYDGEQLLDYATQISSLLEQGLERVGSHNTNLRGRLRVSLPSTLLYSPISEIIVTFLHNNPQVALELSYSDTTADIISDGIDLAIRATELKDSRLKGRRLGTLERLLVCAPTLLKLPPKTIEELSPYPWIKLAQLPNERKLVRNNEETIYRFESQLCVNSVEAAYRFCKMGMGIASLNSHHVYQDLVDGTLVRVLPDWQVAPLPLYAVWPNNATQGGALGALIKVLSQQSLGLS